MIQDKPLTGQDIIIYGQYNCNYRKAMLLEKVQSAKRLFELRKWYLDSEEIYNGTQVLIFCKTCGEPSPMLCKETDNCVVCEHKACFQIPNGDDKK